MIVKLLTEHHLEFRSLKGGCRGVSESTLVKMSNCWKSYAAAHLIVWINALIELIASDCNPYRLTDYPPFLVYIVINGPCREKICLQGFRQSEFQTSSLSYRD